MTTPLLDVTDLNVAFATPRGNLHAVQGVSLQLEHLLAHPLALPTVIAALPVPALAVSAVTLRARILASASVPYQGYAEAVMNLGLPTLPDLENVSTLLDGSTDQSP